MNSPTVSAIIPTFNRRASVTEAVESVLTQTQPPDEIVVVDDGSTDGTAEHLRDRFADGVRCITQPNAGVSAARNRGLREATGELAAFLDSDDRWLPEKLARQTRVMQRAGVALSATNWRWADESDRDHFAAIGLDLPGDPHIEPHPLRIQARFEGSGMQVQTAMCWRAAALRVGGFDARMRIGEDTRFLFRMASEGALAVLSEPLLVRARDDADGNLTRRSDPAYQRESARAAVEILLEAYARAGEEPAEVRRIVRRLLAYHLSKQARHFAVDGALGLARRRAWESLAYAWAGRVGWRNLLTIIAPRAWGLFEKRHRRLMGKRR